MEIETEQCEMIIKTFLDIFPRYNLLLIQLSTVLRLKTSLVIFFLVVVTENCHLYVFVAGCILRPIVYRHSRALRS